jgi:hypothetical protein
MKKTVQFYESGHAYLGKEVAKQGYSGDVEALFNAVTITLIKPNTSLADVKRSLEITIQDIDLRMKQVEV